MKYLCVRHQHLLREEVDVAGRLWQSAMDQGGQLCRAGEWCRARSYCGLAFEIVVLRLRVEHAAGGSPHFATEHLTDAARLLGDCLCRLEQFDEAQEVLRYAHDYLVAETQRCHLTYDAKRVHLRLIEEFLKRSTSVLRLCGRSAQAETLLLMSNKLTSQMRRECLH